MKKLLLLLILLPAILSGQNLIQAEYFFDEDPGYGNGIKLNFTKDASVSLSANLNIGSIKPGFHTLYYRVKDDVNGWGHTLTNNVFVNEPKHKVTNVECFFDEDPGYGSGVSLFDSEAATTDISANIPLEMVDPGYHVFFYRSKDEGSWGITHRHAFYKTLRPKLNAVLYSFDDEEAINILTLENNVWLLEDNFEIDITALDQGNHTMHLWVRNTDNVLSEVWSESFLKGDLAVNAPNTTRVEAYPVPASSVLHMKTDADVLNYSLLSLDGKVVLSGINNFENIDVKDIPGGVYLLLVKLNKGIEVHTIAIEH